MLNKLKSFKILPELQLKNLDQTLYSKSKQKLSFMTKPQLLHLQQTVANMIPSINISKSNNLNKFWVGIFTLWGEETDKYLIKTWEPADEFDGLCQL